MSNKTDFGNVVTVRLTLPALNALYPEGSEARVELTHAITKAMVQQCALSMAGTEVRNLVNDAVTAAVRDADVKQILDARFGRVSGPFEHYIRETILDLHRKSADKKLKELWDETTEKRQVELERKVQFVSDDALRLASGKIRELTKTMPSAIQELVQSRYVAMLNDAANAVIKHAIPALAEHEAAQHERG